MEFFAPCAGSGFYWDHERRSRPRDVAVWRLRGGRDRAAAGALLGLLHTLGGARPVGRGAACTICQEKRRNQLKLVELKGRSLPFCHGCAAQVMRMPRSPTPSRSCATALRRERRDADRREGEKVDQRIFPRERRVGERRGPSREAFADTDPACGCPSSKRWSSSSPTTDIEDVEQTSVRARPARRRARPATQNA